MIQDHKRGAFTLCSQFAYGHLSTGALTAVNFCVIRVHKSWLKQDVIYVYAAEWCRYL